MGFKTCIKRVAWSVPLFFVLTVQAGTVYAKGMDIFIDAGSKDKVAVMKEGLVSFIRENPHISVRLKLYNSSPGRKDYAMQYAMLKGSGANSMIGVPSLKDALSDVLAGDRIYVVITGGGGEWDEIKELLREKAASRIYIVGVGLTDTDDMINLSGVASVSGGEYFNAGNAVVLKTSLSEIEQKANYNLEVKVYKSKFNELTDYLMKRYKYLWSSEVYASGNREKAIASTNIFPARFNLSSGVYDIKISYANKIKWIEGVRVDRSDLVQKAVNFGKGLLSILVYNSGHPVHGVDRRGDSCWWSEVYEAGKRDNPVEVTKAFPPEFELVNGKYDINIHYRGHEKWFYNVEVSEDGATNLNITFPHAKSCTNTVPVR